MASIVHFIISKDVHRIHGNTEKEIRYKHEVLNYIFRGILPKAAQANVLIDGVTTVLVSVSLKIGFPKGGGETDKIRIKKVKAQEVHTGMDKVRAVEDFV